MNEPLLQRTQRRQRQRSISISYELVREIKAVTRGDITISSFIRMAVIEKLEKMRKEWNSKSAPSS